MPKPDRKRKWQYWIDGLHRDSATSTSASVAPKASDLAKWMILEVRTSLALSSDRAAKAEIERRGYRLALCSTTTKVISYFKLLDLEKKAELDFATVSSGR